MFNTVLEGIEVYKKELRELVRAVELQASNAMHAGMDYVDTDLLDAHYGRLRVMEACLGLTPPEIRQLHAECKAPRSSDDCEEFIRQKLVWRP